VTSFMRPPRGAVCDVVPHSAIESEERSSDFHRGRRPIGLEKRTEDAAADLGVDEGHPEPVGREGVGVRVRDPVVR
jgi:hypothetical protein